MQTETVFSAFDQGPLEHQPPPVRVWGRISQVQGQAISIKGLNSFAGLSALIRVEPHENEGENTAAMSGEVISLTDTQAVAIMYDNPEGLRVGQRVYLDKDSPPRPCEDWIGHCLNYKGAAINAPQPKTGTIDAPLQAAPPPAILRKALGERLQTGVAAIDCFLPVCEGQRMGLFAGSGVGKSTLLGAIAKSSNADVSIIALIGERGREVRHFVEDTLGPEGMKNAIVFVATSDEPSAIKMRTALLAMATAEYFRDQGKQVMFLFDSLTRYAEAHRDIALSAGEVPSLRAYPPSTFRALASYCERSGPGLSGSGDISAIFSVLVAGSDMEEPVADMVRGILDGHIILDREIAERGRYPAINLRRSVSRSLPDAASPEENKLLMKTRRLVTKYEESQTLIQAGLYAAGSDPVLDEAIFYYPAIEDFMASIEPLETLSWFTRLAEIYAPTAAVEDEVSRKETVSKEALSEEMVSSDNTAARHKLPTV